MTDHDYESHPDWEDALEDLRRFFRDESKPDDHITDEMLVMLWMKSQISERIGNLIQAVRDEEKKTRDELKNLADAIRGMKEELLDK